MTSFSRQLKGLCFWLMLSLSLALTSCTTNTPMSSAEKAPVSPSVQAKPDSASSSKKETPVKPEAKPGAGGYYLDDGPGDNVPENLDSIPGATLKYELPYKRANKPYVALGQQYTPMTRYAPYKKQGIASWYGKRFHGKKTSTGEIYDMYAMTAAHPILPIPSYAKVSNPANGKSVIVRINDRGPFKRDRLIDLSYAAAYQLRLIGSGSGLVEVEMIDTSPEALSKMNNDQSLAAVSKPADVLASVQPVKAKQIEATPTEAKSDLPVLEKAGQGPADGLIDTRYYVQVGAFKSEMNSEQLQQRIQGLGLAQNLSVTKVYNDGLYRVRLGAFSNKLDAEHLVDSIRKQLNIAAHITTQ